MFSNPVIYGKNTTERIVSCEVIDDTVYLWRELLDGSVEEAQEKHKFWTVATEPLDQDFKRLTGNLAYRYVKLFEDVESWRKETSAWKRKGKNVFTVWNAKENSMLIKGFTYFKGMRTNEVSLLSFDLETTGKDLDKSARILLISNTFRRNGELTRKLFSYDEYDSEGDMIVAWAQWVREMNPAVITGYNINTFDFPYLQHVADREGVTIDLGRDGSNIRIDDRMSNFRKDQSQFYEYRRVSVYGREVVDMFFVALRYDQTKKAYESYRLKYIVEKEGLEDPDRQHYDAALIRVNFQDPVEWAKIKAYAEDDADDCIKLWDLMIAASFYSAWNVAKPFQMITETATGSQINGILIREYLRNYHSLPTADTSEEFEGAISLGVPGVYDNVKKADAVSLYPSIILQYGTYPKEKDPLKALPVLLQTLKDERVKNKKIAAETGDDFYDALQNTQKIFINSVFGFMGAQGLLFNSPKNAAQITAYGRKILRDAVKMMSGQNVEKVIKKIVNKGKENERIEYEWKLIDTDSKGMGYVITNLDTDGIGFHDPLNRDTKTTLDAINRLYPTGIQFESDGYFERFVVIRAKNYFMYDPTDKKGKFFKTKGGSLIAPNKEKALSEFLSNCLKFMATNPVDTIKPYIISEYKNVVNEIMAETIDINRWVTRKTLTKTLMNGERSNETKVMEALSNTDEYDEGDKFYVYFTRDNVVRLKEDYASDHNRSKLLEKLFKTVLVFETLFPDIKTHCINYSLKTKQPALMELLKEMRR